MKSVSTHVLDTARGRPAAGVPILVEKLVASASVSVDDVGALGRGNGAYERVNAATTDADGRVKDLVVAGTLTAGTWRITFDTGAYFAAQATEAFYPEVTVVFLVTEAEVSRGAHYHVPLLLSPFGYSTYRGS